MFHFVKKFVAPFVIATALPFSSHAALIGVQDHGTHFTDTNNGLDWLDVTITAGRSIADVTGQLGSGGEFDGWRYATLAELSDMITDVTGFDPGISGGQTGHAMPENLLDELVNMLGDTYGLWSVQNFGDDICVINPSSCPDGDLRYSRGWLADQGQYSYERYSASITDEDRRTGYEDVVWVSQMHINTTSTSLGSYLVRDSITPAPVSAPASITLLGLGLLGVLVTRKRKAIS